MFTAVNGVLLQICNATRVRGTTDRQVSDGIADVRLLHTCDATRVENWPTVTAWRQHASLTLDRSRRSYVATGGGGRSTL